LKQWSKDESETLLRKFKAFLGVMRPQTYADSNYKYWYQNKHEPIFKRIASLLFHTPSLPLSARGLVIQGISEGDVHMYVE